MHGANLKMNVVHCPTQQRSRVCKNNAMSVKSGRKNKEISV